MNVPEDWIEPPEAPVDVLDLFSGITSGRLGEAPRGFVLAGNGLPCDHTSSAFVRGILMATSQYNAMSPDQRLALQDPNIYPRWRLWGGPFNTKQVADQWDQYMFFWAFNNGQTWIPHGTVCIAPNWAVPWPSNSGFAWEWLYEQKGARYANKVWNGSQYVYQVVG